MCITKEVSISVFIICTLSCIYIYKRNKLNDRWIAILFGYIGIMQFLEYLMWEDQECSGLNQKATRVAFYILIFQPMVSFLIAYYMTNGKIPLWLYLLNIIYITYSVPILYSKLEDNQCSKPCDNSKIGLIWPWLYWKYISVFVFFLCLVSPLLLMKKNGVLYFTLNLIVLLLSGIVGSYRCRGIINIPVGSFWCLMAFFAPIVAIFINK